MPFVSPDLGPLRNHEELAAVAHEIEARRIRFYGVSGDEEEAVRQGLAEAERGEFVGDDVVMEAGRRHES